MNEAEAIVVDDGETSVKVPFATMHVAPLPYECAGLQAYVVIDADVVVGQPGSVKEGVVYPLQAS